MFAASGQVVQVATLGRPDPIRRRNGGGRSLALRQATPPTLPASNHGTNRGTTMVDESSSAVCESAAPPSRMKTSSVTTAICTPIAARRVVRSSQPRRCFGPPAHAQQYLGCGRALTSSKSKASGSPDAICTSSNNNVVESAAEFTSAALFVSSGPLRHLLVASRLIRGTQAHISVVSALRVEWQWEGRGAQWLYEIF